MAFGSMSFKKTAALLTGLLFHVTLATADAPDWCTKSSSNSLHLNIMPMGASLVYGLESGDGNGFRLGLEKLLENNGSTVTMLGTQQSGDMAQNHHEAYLAITIDSYAKKIANSGAYDMNPNIVLLNIGVNDCWYMADEKHPEDDDPSIDPRAADGKYTALRFGNLLSKIKAAFPEALVLASQLTYNTNEWEDKCIQGFNAVLPSVVANATAAGQIIRAVDMYDAVPHDMYREDGTHPNDEGYQLMAKRWFDAAVTALGEVCDEEPATETGEGGEQEAGTSGTATASTSATADGSEASSTSSPAPSLTVDSGTGALATEAVSWLALPLAAWALMG